MMLPSDQVTGPKSGVTLFEVMIVLAILGLILGIVTTSARGPSSTLLLQQDAALLQKQLSELRAKSIRGGVPVFFEVDGLACEDGDLTFFPDGTARGGPLCIVRDDLVLRLDLDPLTGRYSVGGIE